MADARAGAIDRFVLANTRFRIVSFGEDEEGELYAADYGKGSIYRLEATYGTYAAAGQQPLV